MFTITDNTAIRCTAYALPSILMKCNGTYSASDGTYQYYDAQMQARLNITFVNASTCNVWGANNQTTHILDCIKLLSLYIQHNKHIFIMLNMCLLCKRIWSISFIIAIDLDGVCVDTSQSLDIYFQPIIIKIYIISEQTAI